MEEKLKSIFFPAGFRLIAGAIDRNTNITISFTFQYSGYKKNVFHLTLAEGWMFSGKTKRIANSSYNLAETELIKSASHCHVCCEFCKLKSRGLDRVMPRAEVRARAQASYENITLFSLLNAIVSLFHYG